MLVSDFDSLTQSLRVYCKAAPERDLPDLDFTRCQAERGASTIVQMQPEFDTHSNASANVIETRSIASCARFAHGQNT
jgi:hypothetical protein